jgi:hypothetical protein
MAPELKFSRVSGRNRFEEDGRLRERRKIKLKKLACFSALEKVCFHTMFLARFTIHLPAENHVLRTHFRQNPL